MRTVLVILLFFIGLVTECVCVRFAYLGVPGFVVRGESVWLDCGFDLEDNVLYSVKWYKDNVEFYRFLPGNTPSAQMYKLDGVFLDLHRSNATHAFLHKSELQTEGMYGCEVSTEMPQFRTIKAEKELFVYEIPEGNPSIFGVKERYPIGSAVNVTCVFGPSKPAAHLTWYINGEKVPDAYVKSVSTEMLESELLTSRTRLSFAVDPSHLLHGYLSLRCVAQMSLVHSKSSIELIVGTEGAEFQHVPHVPPGLEGPSITGSVARYLVGDIVDVNCSSARSVEPTQLQWFVNDNQVQPEFVAQFPATVFPDGLSSSKVALRFRVQEEHFRSEEMRLRCEAALSQVVTLDAEETSSAGGTPRRDSGVTDTSAAEWQNIEYTSVIVATMFILYLS